MGRLGYTALACAGIGMLLALSTLLAQERLKDLLKAQLVQVNAVKAASNRRHADANSCIYVMGGSQGSLRARFAVAAQLYRDAVARKILIPHRPGITEYDRSLGRNLTNDEWSVRQLVSLGVRSDDIERLHIEQGVFGTWAEAQAVGQLASERGLDGLVVVSSPYHTRRVALSFSHALGRPGVELYVYRSTDEGHLGGLMLEYLKLGIYRSLVGVVRLSEKLRDSYEHRLRSETLADFEEDLRPKVANLSLPRPGALLGADRARLRQLSGFSTRFPRDARPGTGFAVPFAVP